MSESTTSRSQNLNIRIRPEDHKLIKRVAEMESQTVTEFVLSAVRTAAHDRGSDKFKEEIQSLTEVAQTLKPRGPSKNPA